MRNRVAPWEFVLSWSNALFARQFRLQRAVFDDVLCRLKAAVPNYSLSQIRSRASNPLSGPITMEIMLCITLRILAGASYLDMIWYGVQLASVNPIFLKTLSLINFAFPDAEVFNFNPILPGFEQELRTMADDWGAINLRKHGDVVGMQGYCGRPIAAGDGLVVAQTEPSEHELYGMDPALFWNRKGCFGLIVAAFCDAWCRFRYFEVQWPGSTPDITAYKQTSLYSWFTRGLIPEEFHFLLDEAYGPIGGDQHLTPFTSHQLALAKRTNTTRYVKMLGFNHFLSSQRITIERAFGQFVRKWGIFWRPLEHTISTNTTILRVCAKLHNLSITHWKNKGTRAEDIARADVAYKHVHDSAAFNAGHFDVSSPEDAAEQEEVEQMVRRMENRRVPDDSNRARASTRRDDIANDLYDKGFRYSLSGKNAARVAAQHGV